MATNETALATVCSGRNPAYAGFQATVASKITPEFLEDRWRGAIDGNETSEYGDQFSADGLALIALLNRFVMKVARAEDVMEHLDEVSAKGGGSPVSIVDECIEAIHETIVRRIDAFGVAR